MASVNNINLPLAADNSPQLAGQAKPVILVVDDHEDTRLLLKFVLGSQGYQVVEASDGEECLSLTGLLKPDIILMDTSLPKVDGLMATRQIRHNTATRDIPIIFISGHALPEAKVMALAAGGDEYFLKPFNIEELKTSLDFYLRKKIERGH